MTVDRDQTAISQGSPVVDTIGSRRTFRFSEDTPLPQVSLVVGRYEQRSLEVDEVTYSLYSIPGHDLFAEYLDQVSDTLPNLIRELKTDYEAQ